MRQSNLEFPPKNRIVVTLVWRNERGVKHEEDFVLDPNDVSLSVPTMWAGRYLVSLFVRREEVGRDRRRFIEVSQDVWDRLGGERDFTPKDLKTIPEKFAERVRTGAAWEMWPGVMVRGYSPMFDSTPSEILDGI